MRLLISLHDVTPCHAQRLARAERLLTRLGVSDVAYLLVPRFHGAPAIETDQRFLGWMREPRAFRVTWFLHGYFHQEVPRPPDLRGSPLDHLKRLLLTAGEGEFLSLDANGACDRLDRGIESFLVARGRLPTGFVAPAWLFNRHLRPALIDRGFALTEDHRRICLLVRGIDVESPVITWSTRTRLRRRASCAIAPRLLRRWKDSPVLRVAIHPHDLDHDEVVESIRVVVNEARRTRDIAAYADVVMGAYNPDQKAAAWAPT